MVLQEDKGKREDKGNQATSLCHETNACKQKGGKSPVGFLGHDLME